LFRRVEDRAEELEVLVMRVGLHLDLNKADTIKRRLKPSTDPGRLMLQGETATPCRSRDEIAGMRHRDVQGSTFQVQRFNPFRTLNIEL
jgi:hypothetical protein